MADEQDNPYLARAAVNRIWSHLLGRASSSRSMTFAPAIRRATPPCSTPWQRFRRTRLDQRRIIRTILNSRTYQPPRVRCVERRDKQNFSHFLPRRLTAEQLVDH